MVINLGDEVLRIVFKNGREIEVHGYYCTVVDLVPIERPVVPVPKKVSGKEV